MKKIHRYIARKLGGGLFAAALLAGCTPEGAQQEVEFRVPVAVEEVGVATLEDRIVTTGTLRPPEVVTLSGLDNGCSKSTAARGRRLAEGDAVKAGDEIARSSARSGASPAPRRGAACLRRGACGARGHS